MRCLRPLALVALASLATLSLGWSDTGHMIISAIARKDLKRPVQIEVDRLLAIGGTDRTAEMISAACWADDVRPNRPESGPWHYINYHFRKDGKPVTMKPEPENVVKAIGDQLAILKDRRKSDSVRADALRFVLHFIGDLHQPMHATALDSDAFPRGDRGGNDFRIQPPEDSQSSGRAPQNLHALWDQGAGVFGRVNRPLDENGSRLIDAVALGLRAALPRASLSEVTVNSPEKWALESFEFAKTVSYNLQEGSVPSPEYLAKAREVAVRRAVLAGYRLADALNNALK